MALPSCFFLVLDKPPFDGLYPLDNRAVGLVPQLVRYLLVAVPLHPKLQNRHILWGQGGLEPLAEVLPRHLLGEVPRRRVCDSVYAAVLVLHALLQRNGLDLFGAGVIPFAEKVLPHVGVSRLEVLGAGHFPHHVQHRPPAPLPLYPVGPQGQGVGQVPRREVPGVMLLPAAETEVEEHQRRHSVHDFVSELLALQNFLPFRVVERPHAAGQLLRGGQRRSKSWGRM